MFSEQLKHIPEQEDFYTNEVLNGSLSLSKALKVIEQKIRGVEPVPNITGLSVITRQQDSITIGWLYADNSIDDFELEISTDGTGFSSHDADVNKALRVYTISPLSPATNYWLQLRAKKGTKYSNYTPVLGTSTIPDVHLAPGRGRDRDGGCDGGRVGRPVGNRSEPRSGPTFSGRARHPVGDRAHG